MKSYVMNLKSRRICLSIKHENSMMYINKCDGVSLSEMVYHTIFSDWPKLKLQ
jgi:hypothetical protein